MRAAEVWCGLSPGRSVSRVRRVRRTFYAQGGPLDHQRIDSDSDDGDTVILLDAAGARHVYRAERNTSRASPSPGDGWDWNPVTREYVRWSLWHVGLDLTR